MNKIIFGIDPGTIKSGWISLNFNTYNKTISIIDRYHSENKDIFKLILKYIILNSNIIIVIEDIESYGMAIGKSTITTIKYIGRFQQKAIDTGCNNVFLISRPNIKLELCNSKRAKDGNVIKALKNRFGEFGTKKNKGPLYNLKGMPSGMLNHVWSAFALTIAFININYDKKNEYIMVDNNKEN